MPVKFKRLAKGLFNRGIRKFGEKLAKANRDRLEKVLSHAGASASLMASINEKIKADGKVIDTIEQFVEWLIAHQDQIIALIKAVMTLFALV